MQANQLARLLRDNPMRARADALRVVHGKAADDVAHVYLYDVIDAYFGIGAKEFADAINAVDAPVIHVHINSPGGDVFDGRAMASTIKSHPSQIVAVVDGLAASAATTVALAADAVHMQPGSFLMIHRAWSLAFGNADDFMQTAATLEKIDGAIAADYVAKTGKEHDEIVKMMAAETWLTADEAYLQGFADKVLDGEGEQAQAQARSWNVTAYANAPRALTEPAPPGAADDGAALRATNLRRLRLIESVAS